MFSNTATRLVNDTQADLVKNLQNLEPTIQALADVGPESRHGARGGVRVPVHPELRRPSASEATTSTCIVDLDLTIPRLKQGTVLGDPLGAAGDAGATGARGPVSPELHTRSAA